MDDFNLQQFENKIGEKYMCIVLMVKMMNDGEARGWRI